MHSLQRAASLVMSFKQVAVDQTSENRRTFDVLDTVKEILMTLGPGLRKTTHRVELDVPADITMDSYPGPFGQIITNLINNALVHGLRDETAGVITLRVHREGSSRVIVMVSDSGCGIPPQNIERVFDPFFTTRLGQGGSGLGLNIVYNLVTKTLGGQIHVSSPPGSGAIFTLTLPLVAPTLATA
jgi:signal transduction histidine kinase